MTRGPDADTDMAGRATFLDRFAVSRETLSRLDQYVALLQRWSTIKNLVGPGTLHEIWTRHILDCYQLLEVAPQARRWCDLGSGAGLPGLVVACGLASAPGAHVDLIESNSRKAAFLQEAVRALNLPASVHCARIEDAIRRNDNIDVVTARALAPVARLIEMAHPLLITGAQGIFLKGLHIEDELTEAARYWNIQAELRPSAGSPDGRILIVSSIQDVRR